MNERTYRNMQKKAGKNDKHVVGMKTWKRFSCCVKKEIRKHKWKMGVFFV
jgi:hypothetical protein